MEVDCNYSRNYSVPLSTEGIMIQNTHESIHGAVGKRPVFYRFRS